MLASRSLYAIDQKLLDKMLFIDVFLPVPLLCVHRAGYLVIDPSSILL